MEWIEPKIDWGSTDFVSSAAFNRIENNSAYIAEITTVTLPQSVKIDWGRPDYPFANELNRIESNIEYLRFILGLPSSLGWQAPKTSWIPCEPIGYSDLNRIENNLQALKTMLELIPQNYKYCGTFYCGGEAI